MDADLVGPAGKGLVMLIAVNVDDPRDFYLLSEGASVELAPDFEYTVEEISNEMWTRLAGSHPSFIRRQRPK